MRIPTLLGLFLILTALILAGVLFYLRQQSFSQLKKTYTPYNIQLANITDTQAAISWQTNAATISKLIYGSSKNLEQTQGDDRDKAGQARLTHFITLKNLKPDSKYYFKITSQPFVYPDKSLEFKTSKILTQLPQATQSPLSLNPPLRGSVVDSELQPIDEAIVTLNMGAAPLASFTSTAGNFIIPLTKILNSDLSDLFLLKPKTEALLEVIRGEQKSQAKIILPLEQSLPALRLGQNYDLRASLASPSARLIANPNTKFDLNSDGQLNSVDLSIILDNIKKNPRDQKSDLNQDRVVDQKDVEILKRAL